MRAKNMLIIKDANGEIIAAQLEDPTDAEIVTYSTPADPGHTLYRVSNVPEAFYGPVYPDDFKSRITEYVSSDAAEVTSITAGIFTVTTRASSSEDGSCVLRSSWPLLSRRPNVRLRS